MHNYSDEAGLLQTPTGFATLYNCYYPAVYRYIRYRVEDEDIAADLTAQTFLRAMERVHTFQPERGTFAAWLFRIARNQVNSHYRWRKRHPQVSIEQAETIPDEKHPIQTPVETQEESAALKQALQNLSARTRPVGAEIRIQTFTPGNCGIDWSQRKSRGSHSLPCAASPAGIDAGGQQ